MQAAIVSVVRITNTDACVTKNSNTSPQSMLTIP